MQHRPLQQSNRRTPRTCLPTKPLLRKLLPTTNPRPSFLLVRVTPLRSPVRRRPKRDANGEDGGEDDVEVVPTGRPIPASTSRTRPAMPNRPNPILWRPGVVRSTQPRKPLANRPSMKRPVSPDPTETANRQKGDDDVADDVVEMPVLRVPKRHPRTRTPPVLDRTKRNWMIPWQHGSHPEKQPSPIPDRKVWTARHRTSLPERRFSKRLEMPQSPETTN